MAKRKSKLKAARTKTSEAQIMKRKIRASPEWAELRTKLMKEQKIDPITLRPLTRSANCHHLDMNKENYGNLEPSRFVMLNHNSHTLCHEILKIYLREGDFDVFERIKEICLKMAEYLGVENC